MTDIHHTTHSTSHLILRNQRVDAQRAINNRSMTQVPSQKELKNLSRFVMKKPFKSLNERKVASKEKDAQIEKARREGLMLTINKQMQDTANYFNQRNDELNARTLMILRGLIKDSDTKEDILEKVLDLYPDFTLADEALEYLLQTTHGELRNQVQLAKDELNARYGREIVAGKNIALQAKEFSEAGLGSPTALRDMYRDITGNPREVHTLFDELSRLFDYEKLKTASNFLFHSLGADLKAKGPSISRAELARLMEDTRTLQAILGVYFFFKERMKLIHKQFANNELAFPDRLTFEVLAQKFMQLIKERYISADRVKQLAKQLGVTEEELAQIILFTQMRDAIRLVSPRIYRNQKHKEEALAAIIEALEDLEEELEEEEEE
ncbi:MAG: YopN family type III secretion system gatekeeper subunit [Chlamydiae bacterium CG10_big_fil_rev_8_21_14_0_10_35_9]|nr:MAG: YopN family type III secretion system gatekeeper subunit [Chlamydiae bacterium CG10_big_fil_rev_8_21_14_0_10_35_9]